MNKIIKIVLLLIIIVLAIFLVSKVVMRDDDLTGDANGIEEKYGDENAEKIRIIDGFKAIQLDDEVASSAGIQAEHLSAMVFTPEFSAYAKVLDIAPLVQLKTEHENLLAQKKILKTELDNQNKVLKRAEKLYRIKSLSAGELEKSRADRDIKASELSAINVQLQSNLYKIKSSWGQTVASLVLDPEHQTEFDSLAAYEKILILVSLLKDQSLTSPEQQVFISSLNKRNTAKEASYLDKANQSDNPLYGESYFYLLDSEKLRPGMRLFAWIKASGDEVSGLYLPERAVIWYANEAWIYVNHGDNVFVRKPLGKASKLEDGWLLNKGQIDDNALVVIKGGQTLLSEEFKWAIPNEDDD